MEPLIRALNDPKNQGVPAQIHEIQRQLQLLQRDPSAWQAGLALLEHQEAIMRFYGALTLTIKINADWNNDKFSKNAEHRSSLLQALVTSYVRLALAEDEKFVLQKLASTLTLLYQKLGPEWPHPIRHVLTSIVHGDYVQTQDLPPISDLVAVLAQRSSKQVASVMRLMITIAEDVNSRSPGSTIQQQLASTSGDMLELDSYILLSHCQRFISPDTPAHISATTRAQAESEILASLALEALPLWTGLMKLQEATASKAETAAASKNAVLCTRATLQMLLDDALGHASLQALVTMQTLSPRLITKAEPTFVESLANSPFARKWASALIQGDFSPEAMSFVELVEAVMLHVDVTSPDYILSGRFNGVLQLLLMLLRCDGVAGIDDQVCQTMLETANNIVEGYTDWDAEPDAEQSLRHFTQQACAACLDKIRFPLEEMSAATRTWDKDDLSKFREFRFDVQDFLQSAFGLLGRSLIEAIVANARREPSESGWVGFEAGLYCLMAFADTMTSNPATYDELVSSVLDSYYFQQVLQAQEVPDMARQTCIRFVSEMTGYFKRHPSLMQVLNFLFSSLHLPSSATVASRAIYMLCESQRSSLTDALPGFLTSLNTIQDLRGMDRHRIYGAVAAIIQSLSSNTEKLQPLTDILDMLQRDVKQSELMQPDDEAFIQHNTDLLQTLAAIGRGLRAPEDVAEDKNIQTLEIDFWVSGHGSVVQQKVLKAYQHIMQRVGLLGTHEFVEASCDFIRSGFTETHPSPFKFDSATSTELVASNISIQSPNIDAVMGSASSLLAAVSREEFQPYFQRLVHPVLGGMEQLLASDDRIAKIRDSSYPSAALDFMSRLFPRWGQILLELQEAQQALSLCLELALIVITEPDTLPRRSAAQLFGSFVEMSKPGKIQTDAAKQNIDALLKQYIPRITASFLRLIGGECARSELDILSEQIRRYVSSQPMAFKTICQEAMKEENTVLAEKALRATTLEQRLRFVAQIDGLRGARKTNDVVKEFWVACRGSEFSYIA